MKLQLTATIFGGLLLLCSYTCAGEKFSSTLFSIEIPTGMIADDQKVDSISLAFAGDNELEKGTLSVSARKANVVSLEDQWLRVKPVITRNKLILYEKEVAASGLTWKTVGLKGQAGQAEMQSVVYYGIFNDVIYSLHYHCQEGRCEEINAAFHKVQNSFNPMSNSPTRH